MRVVRPQFVVCPVCWREAAEQRGGVYGVHRDGIGVPCPMAGEPLVHDTEAMVMGA